MWVTPLTLSTKILTNSYLPIIILDTISNTISREPTLFTKTVNSIKNFSLCQSRNFNSNLPNWPCTRLPHIIPHHYNRTLSPYFHYRKCVLKILLVPYNLTVITNLLGDTPLWFHMYNILTALTTPTLLGSSIFIIWTLSDR